MPEMIEMVNKWSEWKSKQASRWLLYSVCGKRKGNTGQWRSGMRNVEGMPPERPHTHVSHYSFHRSCFMVHPSCFVLRPSSFVLHPSSFILHSASLTLHPPTSIRTDGWTQRRRMKITRRLRRGEAGKISDISTVICPTLTWWDDAPIRVAYCKWRASKR